MQGIPKTPEAPPHQLELKQKTNELRRDKADIPPSQRRHHWDDTGLPPSCSMSRRIDD